MQFCVELVQTFFDISFVSCKTCTTCNPDILSHAQCNWPLGGEILLLAYTWQPKFFFSLSFSVFSWDIDKILSYKSKPPTKILILLCFNSPYNILIFFFLIILLLCDEENGDWDQMAGAPPLLAGLHLALILLTSLHQTLPSSNFQLTNFRFF